MADVGTVGRLTRDSNFEFEFEQEIARPTFRQLGLVEIMRAGSIQGSGLEKKALKKHDNQVLVHETSYDGDPLEHEMLEGSARLSVGLSSIGEGLTFVRDLDACLQEEELPD